jgi:hypothetical protein
MTHTDVITHVRDFTLDRRRALEALRDTWRRAYLIDVDASGLWWGLRRDGRKGVCGTAPDELNAAIMADFAARPVTELDQIPRLERLRAEHPEVIILRTGPVPTAWLGLEKVTGGTLAEMLDKLDAALERAAPGFRPAPAGPPTPGAAPAPARM